jgi:hypothetical protein
MSISEITLEELNAEEFIDKQVTALGSVVGEQIAINALSGGVDSSVVTLLGHRAFGERLKTYFIDNGLMREGEPQQIVKWFEDLGVKVEIVDAREKFFAGLEGVSDPEEKREKGITQVFYKDVFAELVRQSGAKVLLQGTNYTDVEETAAGVKRQHNVFEQIGIDPEEAFGYQVVEPILQLRKPAVRVVARALGLPAEISERPPFPGPALAARVIGEQKSHDDRRGRTGRLRRFPVPGDSSPRHGDRNSGRRSRLRSADRSALLGEHRRRHRHADRTPLRHTPANRGSHRRRGSGCGERHLQRDGEAAELHRSRLRATAAGIWRRAQCDS